MQVKQKLRPKNDAFLVMDQHNFQQTINQVPHPDWMFHQCKLSDIDSVRLAPQSLLLLEQCDVSTLVSLLNRYHDLNHIMSLAGPSPYWQLENSLSRISEQQGWGIEQYCPRNMCTQVTMSHYRQKTKILSDIHTFVSRANGFAELPNTVATIASELIMNAAFDAPIDPKTGLAKYANLPRTSDLSLSDSEHIEVSYGLAGDFIVLSTRDSFGSLDRQKIVSNLYRCDQKGTDQVRHNVGGAGVGLYLLLNMCSQLDIYIKPGQSTEVVAIINASKRQKDYELAGTAINIFVREQ